VDIINKFYNFEIDKDLPVELREKYSINIKDLPKYYQKIKELSDNFFIISTCYRTGIYFITEKDPEKIKEILFPNQECKFRKGINAIKHLIKVSCGLESQIFAETEIIHQIKKFYLEQKEHIKEPLNDLINFSLSSAKEFQSSIIPKIKKEKENLSNIIAKEIKNYKDYTVFLVGYGELNKAIYKAIKSYFKNILIFSDSNKKFIPKKLLLEKIKEYKKVIIISATESEKFIINYEDYLPDDTIIFDLSVPSTIHPKLSQKYKLFNIDFIKQKNNLKIEDNKIILSFINQKLNEFINKLTTIELKDEIKEYYNYPLKVAEEKMNKYFPEIIKIINNSQKNEIIELLKYINQKIVNQTLQKPTERIKELYIISKKKKIIVGTRGSLLAINQTNQTIQTLKLYFPQYEFHIKTIKTSGDKKIYTNNSFVKELEESLIKEEIDIAVHSLKDIPYNFDKYLEIAAIINREDPRDALISRNKETIWTLKPNSIIGTSSERRKAQITQLRSDLIVKEIRGNLDTRIKKLLNGEYDAIVVSLAGLKRLNLEKLASYIFSIEEIVPAPGQGAIAIQTRKKSYLTDILKEIDDPTIRKETEIEREFMGKLEFGCNLPLGANCKINENITFSYFVKIQDIIIKEKLINPDINGIINQIKKIKEEKMLLK